MRCTTNTTKII